MYKKRGMKIPGKNRERETRKKGKREQKKLTKRRKAMNKSYK